MEVFLEPPVVDAYVEMCLGAMVLRLQEVQNVVTKKYAKAGITSSYTHLSKDLILYGNNIVKAIASEGLKGSQKLRNAFTQINRIFVIAMWDILTSTKTYKQICDNPDVQFLRHIRNGCAHDGRFKIDDPLKHPAKWRDKEILFEMNGTPIFPNFLIDGDVYLLLYDINETYFK